MAQGFSTPTLVRNVSRLMKINLRLIFCLTWCVQSVIDRTHHSGKYNFHSDYSEHEALIDVFLYALRSIFDISKN